jgi:small neutral amino acid transporter SnatA (MarC family)
MLGISSTETAALALPLAAGPGAVVIASVFSNVFRRRFQTFIGLVFVAYFEVIIFQIVVAHVLPHDLRKAD